MEQLVAQRFDIHIQTLPIPEQINTFRFMSFGFKNTLGVKGFQQLINQWLKCLLTRRGSDPADLSYGTPFAALVGSTVPLEDARDVTVLAVDQCNEQVTRANRADVTLAPAERLASAEITDFVAQPSDPGFQVTVEIKNQAGELLAFNLPVHTATV